MKIGFKLSLITAIIIVFASCKTKSNLTKQVQGPEIKIVESLVNKIVQTQPTFKTANVSKMSIEIKMNERNFNVSSSCKIKKDSAIHLSIQPLFGIEAFKAEFTPDSMKVIDKLNKKYYVVDYSFFNKKFGVEIDFNSFQSLVFNQFFCVGQKEISTKSLILTPLNDGRNKIDFESNSMMQSSEISAGQLIEKVLLIAKNTGYELKTTYEDFATVNSINFPQKISMTASNTKTNAFCNFSILRVEFNGKVAFSSINTDRYTRGSIDQLIKK